MVELKSCTTTGVVGMLSFGATKTHCEEAAVVLKGNPVGAEPEDVDDDEESEEVDDDDDDDDPVDLFRIIGLS